MADQYEPFVVRVVASDAESYLITAEFRGVRVEASISVDLPLVSDTEVKQALNWLGQGTVDREYARDLGTRLFNTLFVGKIGERFREAYALVQPDHGLRVTLYLAPDLNHLPWELMYDPEGIHGYLARSTTAPLARYFSDLPAPISIAPSRGPLRILVITASPQGYPAVSENLESRTIVRTFVGHRPSVWRMTNTVRQRSRRNAANAAPPRLQQLVTVDVLENATRSRLQSRIASANAQNKGYHVIHFVGHGYVTGAEGFLLLETGEGGADPIPGREFAELVADRIVNLVLLNACQTATQIGLFNSVAREILQRGIPAVICMQAQVLDRAAVEFAGEFYRGWAEGETLERSLAEARRLISSQTPGAVGDWSIPVLFMSPDAALDLRMDLPSIQMPWPVRVLRWAFGAFILALGTTSALLSIPQTNEQVRTEVPLARCLAPYPMNGKLDIAVADFGILTDEDQPPTRYALGQERSRSLARRLEFELTEGEMKPLTVSRDPKVRDYCMVTGSSIEARREAAVELARLTDAELVIYGYLLDYAETPTWQLDFVTNVPEWEWSELFTDGGLSMPIYQADEDKWEQRARALARLFAGLVRLSIHHDAEGALLALDEDKLRGWQDIEGKEVLYLFRGVAYLEEAIQAAHNPILQGHDAGEKREALIAVRQAIGRARNEFARALVSNPVYSRAYIGLATADYTEAYLQHYLGGPYNFSLIYSAIDQYDTLLAPANEQQATQFEKSAGAYVDFKLHYDRGLAYYVIATEFGHPEAISRAQGDFGEVVRAYEELTKKAPIGFLCERFGWLCPRENFVPAVVRDLGSGSYCLLADLNDLAGNDTESVAAYRRCINETIEQDGCVAMAYRLKLGLTLEEMGYPDQAQDVYLALCRGSCWTQDASKWRGQARERLTTFGFGDEQAKEACK